MAEGKRVVNGDGEGFVMMRFPGVHASLHASHPACLALASSLQAVLVLRICSQQYCTRGHS